MEQFKQSLQAAIDNAPTQEVKNDLMRIFYMSTGEHPVV